jgi:hypothetical protein
MGGQKKLEAKNISGQGLAENPCKPELTCVSICSHFASPSRLFIASSHASLFPVRPFLINCGTIVFVVPFLNHVEFPSLA